jgi:CheY-like chemotaxis protein
MARVLLVDDDPDIRYVTARMLRRSQHEVSAVESARQAIACFERGETFHLILCDRTMPTMNGLQLLASLRAREMKQPYFVFLSAEAQPSEIDEAMMAGADGYLVKPFEPQGLLAEVHRLVGGE